MKSWGIIIVAAIIVASVVTGGVLYSRLSSQLNSARTDIERLKASVGLPAVGNPSAATMTMVDLISMVQPVIVRVDVEGSGFQASGSGVIIRSGGYVMTNEHVIDKATSITVTLSDDTQYQATVTSSDAHLDLAIIKLTGSPSGLPAAVLGSTSDVVVGGVVVAAGFPLGPGLPGPASLTQGIVSAIRNVNGQKYIQSDVVINPGNSGGALVARSSGKVIGITSAGVISGGEDVEGINLAIPIDVMLDYIQANLK